MAQSHETGNSTVTTDKPITDLLSSPLSSDWTIEGLAERLLTAIVAQPEAQSFVLDAEATTDRQSRRLIRPLLACLATKSGAENGTPVNLYGGELVFERCGPEGPIRIVAQFENKPGMVRIAFRRSAVEPARACSRSDIPQAAPPTTPKQVQTTDP
jgi:hypothetical protein